MASMQVPFSEQNYVRSEAVSCRRTTGVILPGIFNLKRVYVAPTEEIALAELNGFDEKWSGKYPKIAKSWKDNWANFSTYFKYPEAVRSLIYITNAIEGFNRQHRKVTKSKMVFPSDDSLLKMLYLAMMDITKKRTGHRQDWGADPFAAGDIFRRTIIWIISCFWSSRAGCASPILN